MEVLASYDCSALYLHIHYSFDMHAQLSCNESIKLSYLNLPIYLHVLRPFSANCYLMHTKFIHYRCNETSEQQNLVHWRMADFWPLSLYYNNFHS